MLLIYSYSCSLSASGTLNATPLNRALWTPQGCTCAAWLRNRDPWPDAPMNASLDGYVTARYVRSVTSLLTGPTSETCFNVINQQCHVIDRSLLWKCEHLQRVDNANRLSIRATRRWERGSAPRGRDWVGLILNGGKFSSALSAARARHKEARRR